jgi:hypothetical protein
VDPRGPLEQSARSPRLQRPQAIAAASDVSSRLGKPAKGSRSLLRSNIGLFSPQPTARSACLTALASRQMPPHVRRQRDSAESFKRRCKTGLSWKPALDKIWALKSSSTQIPHADGNCEQQENKKANNIPFARPWYQPARRRCRSCRKRKMQLPHSPSGRRTSTPSQRSLLHRPRAQLMDIMGCCCACVSCCWRALLARMSAMSCSTCCLSASTCAMRLSTGHSSYCTLILALAS